MILFKCYLFQLTVITVIHAQSRLKLGLDRVAFILGETHFKEHRKIDKSIKIINNKISIFAN